MKFALCGILCVFYFTVAAADESTRLGVAQTKTRIVGGLSANIGNYPWQVSMRLATDNYGQAYHFCGGSIINNKHIVTAAHCVDKKLDLATMRKIKVYTGTTRSDVGGEAHTVRKITVHPKYTGASTFYLNDIAIVTLNEPIAFNYAQQPIGLPARDPVNGLPATITGWGDTRPNGETPINLQKADVRLLVASQCKLQLPYHLEPSQVCASVRPGYGVCSGDSGGPLVANRQLIGIASYVVECGSGKPEVYTNVHSFIDFIMQTINAREYSNFNNFYNYRFK